ncbi:YARHG domain-containing protein [Wenyingzhuangia sp. IMCC45574]
MKKKIFKSLLILLFISNLIQAQYWGAQEIKESDLSPWIPKFEIEYQGLYHFGESEGESNLNLFFTQKGIIAQITSGYWEEGTGFWKKTYKTLTNVKITKSGIFSSDQHNGRFIRYRTKSGEYIKGLRINNPWSSWIEDSKFEIGTVTKVALEKLYYGKHPSTSFLKLEKSKLKKMKKSDLRIMRNEIFARYGYEFKKGGEMFKYFKEQEWYRPEHKNVSSFLTDIELENIDIIKQVEQN